jgi:membrane protein implicated in regulation of membrane protease activity
MVTAPPEMVIPEVPSGVDHVVPIVADVVNGSVRVEIGGRISPADGRRGTGNDRPNRAI